MARKTTTTDTATDPKLSSATKGKKGELRAKDGTFLPGKSGNPNGRPKGRKNQLTVLKQDLEIALREGLDPHKIKAVVDSMVELALQGNVGAGKLILDKVVSNARESEDEKETSGGLKIIIEHANVDVTNENRNIIDVTPEEISNE